MSMHRLSLRTAPLRRGFCAPAQADCVVIGGGAVGASTFYHLAKRGLRPVMVEKAKLTAGTTWHSAGLFWSLRPNDVDIQLLSKTKDLVKPGGELAQLTGADVFTPNGGLFTASTPERLDEYKRLQTTGLFYGIESQILSPADAKELYPLMGVDDLVGALYSPGDGLIDPSGVTEAYVKAGKQLGGVVLEQTEVLGVEQANGAVTAVVTDKGRIASAKVVNCGGAWAKRLGAMCGVDVPLVAMRHAYVVTDKIPDLGFLPNIRDHDLSVYIKWQGQALAIGGYEPHPIFWEVERHFEFGLFDLDYDAFEFNLNGHFTRVPSLENVGIAHTVSGPESFTPDHKPLMGEAPNLRGFYLGCAFNSSGIMLSGGCGEQLAEWVEHGRPSMDMFGYDINRFHPTQSRDAQWTDQRSHEAYTKNYAIVYPHDQALAGRATPSRRYSPFYERLIAKGGWHIDTLGYERPFYFSPGEDLRAKPYDYYGAYAEATGLSQYGPEGPVEPHAQDAYATALKHEYTFQWPTNLALVQAEHDACRDRVVAIDMSAFGKLEISGPDAEKCMLWLCCNNVAKGPGRATYTPMLNDLGGVECDLTVTQLEDRFYVCSPGGAAQHDEAWIKSVIAREQFDVQIADVTAQYGVLSVQGRHSRSVLQELVDAPLDDKSFPFGHCQTIDVAGVQCRVLRLTFVGELGFELHVPAANGERVYDAVFAAGEKYGIRDCGYAAVEILSMQKGYRHWHADVRPDDSPREAGLGFTVRKDGGFLGEQALEARGVQKRLVYVTVPSGEALHGLECLYRDGVPCGYLRRAGYDFVQEAALGIGYVHAQDCTVKHVREASYELDIMGRRVPCLVSTRAPFDPKNLRVKGEYALKIPDARADEVRAAGAADAKAEQ